MTEAAPETTPASAWRGRLERWRNAAVRLWARPESVTVLHLDSEEVARLLRRSRGRQIAKPEA